jgi:SPW repeat
MNDLWQKEQYPDLVSLAAGSLLMLAPFAFGFAGEGAASWNAVLSGCLIVILTLVALVAFEEWQAWWILAAGVWVTVSPWLMEFHANTLALRVHLILGMAVAAASAIRIWFERDPPIAT